ncbi:MAG TPA: hypothetical protein PL033_02020 [Candidatus Brocadiia bacterium]|nr:hypothetical protein [Candidatus Brocadiia bacterium]
MKIRVQCPQCGKSGKITVRNRAKDWRCECGRICPMPKPEEAEVLPDKKKKYTPRLKCAKCANRIGLPPDNVPAEMPDKCPACGADMVLRFLCPQCHGKVEGPPSAYGKTRKCPGCGASCEAGKVVVYFDGKEDGEEDDSKPGVPAAPVQAGAPAPQQEAEPEALPPQVMDADDDEAEEDSDEGSDEGSDEEEAPAATVKAAPLPAPPQPQPQPAIKPLVKADAPPQKKPAEPQIPPQAAAASVSAAPAAAKAKEEIAEGFKLICDKCEAPMTYGARFCQVCGHDHESDRFSAKKETDSVAINPVLRNFLPVLLAAVATPISIGVLMVSVKKGTVEGAILSLVGVICALLGLSASSSAASAVAVLERRKAVPELAGRSLPILSASAWCAYIFAMLFSLLALACCTYSLSALPS